MDRPQYKDSERRKTPLGDRRERATWCIGCGCQTWNIQPVCDDCADKGKS